MRRDEQSYHSLKHVTNGRLKSGKQSLQLNPVLHSYTFWWKQVLKLCHKLPTRCNHRKKQILLPLRTCLLLRHSLSLLLIHLFLSPSPSCLSFSSLSLISIPFFLYPLKLTSFFIFIPSSFSSISSIFISHYLPFSLSLSLSLSLSPCNNSLPSENPNHYIYLMDWKQLQEGGDSHSVQNDVFIETTLFYTNFQERVISFIN